MRNSIFLEAAALLERSPSEDRPIDHELSWRIMLKLGDDQNSLSLEKILLLSKN